jgi:hypothetical protein
LKPATLGSRQQHQLLVQKDLQENSNKQARDRVLRKQGVANVLLREIIDLQQNLEALRNPKGQGGGKLQDALAAISKNMAPASCAIAVQLNTIMFKPMQSTPVPVSLRPADDSRLQGQWLLVVETGTIANQTILRGMMIPALMFSAYCRTEDNFFLPGTVNSIPESWQILHGDSLRAQYKAVVRNVTETHCICRSCFSHDTASQCPALPKWYLQMKAGHAQQERTARACCVVCAKLGSHTNSSNSDPTRTCPPKDVAHMAYFFKKAYDVDAELRCDGTKHLCSTHFQHYQKRLSSKVFNAAAQFEDNTGSPWVGTLYRKCVCCSNATATEWHLAGQHGPDTENALNDWLQSNNGAYSDINALTYRCIDPSTVALDDEAIPVADLTGHVSMLGCCEWLCHHCWQLAVPQHLQGKHQRTDPSQPGPSTRHGGITGHEKMAAWSGLRTA